MKQRIVSDPAVLEAALAGKKVLLVCGSSYDRLGLNLGVDALRFSEFSPNPRYEDVCRGVEAFRRGGCDAILAVGGGSAMDTAKCIKLFAGMDPAAHYLTQPFRDSGIFLAAVPTTAGTGSESTRHAVIYHRGVKQSVSHPSIVPDLACLLPQVLENLPLYQRKCTLLDALCQAIESWWSKSATEESIAFSREAIVGIRDNYKNYLTCGECAGEILLAANFSGRAINITATTAAHAMSYKLTSLYGIPHGHAVALCMEQVWAYMQHAPELAPVFRALPVDLAWYRKLLEELQLQHPAAGNRQAELDVLVASVNPERLGNNPLALDAEVLRSMYERILA